jgi:hypothetical protein
MMSRKTSKAQARRNKAGAPATEPAPSSNILAHSYSPETEQLTITYRGGRQYRYDGVPEEIADRLAGLTEQKGAFVHQHIIDKYPATKIDLDG